MLLRNTRCGGLHPDRDLADEPNAPSPHRTRTNPTHSHTQTVLALQRGADPDKEMARAAAARFVGLTIPEGVPLGPPLAPGKYAAALAARISGDVSATSLEGVDYLKAQYYGVKEVFAEKQRRK